MWYHVIWLYGWYSQAKYWPTPPYLLLWLGFFLSSGVPSLFTSRARGSAYYHLPPCAVPTGWLVGWVGSVRWFGEREREAHPCIGIILLLLKHCACGRVSCILCFVWGEQGFFFVQEMQFSSFFCLFVWMEVCAVVVFCDPRWECESVQAGGKINNKLDFLIKTIYAIYLSKHREKKKAWSSGIALYIYIYLIIQSGCELTCKRKKKGE